MRLLFINQFFWPDTAATSQLLTDLSRTLGESGAEIWVICGPVGYGAPDSTPPPPAHIVRCGRAAFSRGKVRRILAYASFLAGAVWSTFRVPRADVVVTLTTPPLVSVLGTLSKLTRGSRHFIWEMDMYPDVAVDLGVMGRESLLTRWIGRLADWSRKSADGIIALGEDMKARLIRRGIPAERIRVAPNWADGQEIVPGSFPSGSLVVHYSGNFGLAHDIDTVAGAIAQLESSERIRFVFAGGGPRQADLKKRCQGLENVEFRGYVERAELGDSLGQGHVGLVTQLPETCGSVVPSKTYGIMAAGRPILYVGPEEAEPARLIAQHDCGWRVETGNIVGLINLLEHLVNEPDMIREKGARARTAFETHYDRPIGVARIAELLGVPAPLPQTFAAPSVVGELAMAENLLNLDESLRAFGETTQPVAEADLAELHQEVRQQD